MELFNVRKFKEYEKNIPDSYFNHSILWKIIDFVRLKSELMYI